MLDKRNSRLHSWSLTGLLLHCTSSAAFLPDCCCFLAYLALSTGLASSSSSELSLYEGSFGERENLHIMWVLQDVNQASAF